MNPELRHERQNTTKTTDVVILNKIECGTEET